MRMLNSLLLKYSYRVNIAQSQNRKYKEELDMQLVHIYSAIGSEFSLKKLAVS